MMTAYNKGTMGGTPYFNDFDEDKKFLQMMFKPGFPVQARELSQLQSILQNHHCTQTRARRRRKAKRTKHAKTTKTLALNRDLLRVLQMCLVHLVHAFTFPGEPSLSYATHWKIL